MSLGMNRLVGVYVDELGKGRSWNIAILVKN